jgi:hypothetical protein
MGRTTRHALSLCLSALVLVLVLAAAPALALRSLHGVPTPVRNGAKYVDPVASRWWEPSRTDMGMDWMPLQKLPVVAIGDAVILGSSMHSGWPGGGFIWYELLDGNHAGDIVYVAEHLRNLAPAGKLVHAGQQIALALSGYPWTEWGWADQWGSARAAPCYKEGKATNSGKEMERFLVSLGAAPYDPPGRGPNGPTGKLC